MCQLKPFGDRQVDDCLTLKIDWINKHPLLKTLASCCGHNKYPTTIIIKDIQEDIIIEFFSRVLLKPKYKNGKPRKRFYKKDKEGFYYLPELLNHE